MPLKFFSRFLKSLGFAFQGVRTFYCTQYNAKIHLWFTLGVTVAGLVAGLSRTDWALLVLAIGLVWTAEAANTAIEFLTDLVTTEIHPLAKKVKDVAAGAVLLATAAAIIIGLLVFAPRIWDLIN